MQINTLESGRKIYQSFNGWEESFDQKRVEMLKQFPCSVIVEGDYLEYDMATDWCTKKIGAKNESWTDLWYERIGYEYGFWEFFFKNEKQAQTFRNFVPSVYADATDRGGKKWRTQGYEVNIELH